MTSLPIHNAPGRGKVVSRIGAGALIGVLELVFVISFAALLYQGQGAQYLASGIGLMLLGAIPAIVLIALLGSYKGHISAPQDAPAVIMALVIASISPQLAAASPAGRFVTVAAAIALTTLFTGVFFVLMGQFKLGSLVRFLPYPVIGGFLAGTGWLLLIGGIEFMAEVPVGLSKLGELFRQDVLPHWLPGLLAGIGLMWLLNRHANYYLLPIALLAMIALFYGAALLSQTSMMALSAQGWLIGPFTSDSLLQSMYAMDARQIDWQLIGSVSISLASVALISLASFLLNVSGIELAVGQELDFNRDLRSVGLGNVAAGLLGGAVLYPAISTTTLNHKLSGGSRLAALVAAVIFAVPIFTGVALLSYIPKLMIGTLLIVFGLSFLHEWLYQAWWKFSRVEYAIVALIVASIAMLGFLPGVGVGFLAAVALFVANYSRISVIKHALSGVEARSRFARSPDQRARLNELGQQAHVLKLQGYIFFGTAHSLLQTVRDRVNDSTLPALRYLILDFREVSGLDASAMLSLGKMKQMLRAQAITLLVTGPSEKIRRRLTREAFVESGPDSAGIFPDVDHGMEWVENALLDMHGPSRAEHQSLRDVFMRQVRDEALLDTLFSFMEKRHVPTGGYLMRQAEQADVVYFVESGQVTAQLENSGQKPVRLESMGPGHVIGELGFYLKQKRTAAVIADVPSVVYSLSADSLARMEETAPGVAFHFHRLIIQLLAARTTHLIRVVEAFEK